MRLLGGGRQRKSEQLWRREHGAALLAQPLSSECDLCESLSSYIHSRQGVCFSPCVGPLVFKMTTAPQTHPKHTAHIQERRVQTGAGKESWLQVQISSREILQCCS